MALEQKIEAVLFYKGEPETKERLAKLLDVAVSEIEDAITKLDFSLSKRGIRLLKIDDKVELVTAPETSEVINKMHDEELVRDLGKAASETLSVVLYRGPVSRAEIDYIRGVNCSFVLRNLQIRGLVEKVKNNEKKIYEYTATTELLKHLGVSKVEDLPDYKKMRDVLNEFESSGTVEEE